jgi:hypothetical protein
MVRIPVSFERPVATTQQASPATVLKVTNIFNAVAVPLQLTLVASGNPILIHSIVIMNSAGANIDITVFDEQPYAYAAWNETPAAAFTMILAPGLDTANGGGNPALITRGLFPSVLLEGERITIDMAVAAIDAGSIYIYYEEVP